MKVKIKEFNVEMEIANNGSEFEVRSPDGSKPKGDLVLTKTGLEWCKGRTRVGNGIKVTWQEFINRMNT